MFSRTYLHALKRHSLIKHTTRKHAYSNSLITQGQQYKIKIKSWDDWNKYYKDGIVCIDKDKNYSGENYNIDSFGNKYVTAPSYTHYFFDGYNSITRTQYLNNSGSNKKILQLGAADGRFLSEYQNLGWEVLAYDFSKTAISELEKKGIEARDIDLNAIDNFLGTLTYVSQLEKDISKPVNILLIRILQYLDLRALHLLMYTLIDKAAPGSVFYISGNIEKRSRASMSAGTPYCNKIVFFAARTDMDIVEVIEEESKGNFVDESFIVRRE